MKANSDKAAQSLSGSSARVLVIGDLHAPKSLMSVEAAIADATPDRVILLGDYLDHFNDEPGDAERIGRWLQARMEDPMFTFLLGNHDLPYLFPGRIYCPGYEIDKAVVFRRVLDTEAFLKVAKLAHWIDGTTLVTHAGLSLQMLPPDLETDALPVWLDREIQTAWEDLRDSDGSPRHWIWRAGYSRLGNQPVGGILWCDFEDEFEPVPGLSQVFGHTPGCEVRVRSEPDGTVNICADTCGGYGSGPAEVLYCGEGTYTPVRVRKN